MGEEVTAAKFVGDEMSEILDRFGDLAVAVFVERLGPDPERRRRLRQLLEGGDERCNS
jgi:hypothetical protein